MTDRPGASLGQLDLWWYLQVQMSSSMTKPVTVRDCFRHANKGRGVGGTHGRWRQLMGDVEQAASPKGTVLTAPTMEGVKKLPLVAMQKAGII